MVWDVVVATCMKGKVLRMETLELGVWVAVAVGCVGVGVWVAQSSRWKECRRTQRGPFLLTQYRAS